MASESDFYWDTDGRIQYSDSWELTVLPPVDETGSAGTFHSTLTSGSTASLSFIGSQITVHGYVFPGNASVSSTYTIDGGEAVSRTQSSNGGQTPLDTDLYKSEALTLARHTITVRVVDVSPLRNYTIIYFLIDSADQGIVDSSSSDLSSNGQNAAAPTGGSDPDITSEQTSSGNVVTGVSLGTVIGVVFGGVGLLVVIALMWILFRRYRKRRKAPELDLVTTGGVETGEAPSRSYGAIDPFNAIRQVTSPPGQIHVHERKLAEEVTTLPIRTHTSDSRSASPGPDRSPSSVTNAVTRNIQLNRYPNISSLPVPHDDQQILPDPPAYDARGS